MFPRSLCFFFVLLAYSQPLLASDDVETMPGMKIARIHGGERLSYAVSWGIFEAGQATLDIRQVDTEDGSRAYLLLLRAHTEGIFGAVYPLDVTIWSLVSADLQRSLGFHKVQNGVITHMDFDWENRLVHYNYDDEQRPSLSLPEDAVDPLGIVFVARNSNLAFNEDLTGRFTDGKRVVEASATVTEREDVETEAGSFKTLIVQPQLENVGGVFARSRNPRLTIWVSDDHNHYPVRVSSEIMLGSIVGELTGVTALVPPELE